MKIPVEYIETNYGIEFHRSWPGLRMWLYDASPNVWFRTLGSYCPHLNMNGFECQDCAGCYD